MYMVVGIAGPSLCAKPAWTSDHVGRQISESHHLLYHSFALASSDAFREPTVDPALFSEQVAALADAGCRFVRFRTFFVISAGPHPGAPPTIWSSPITVDDGLADVTTPERRRPWPPTSCRRPCSARRAYVGATAGWLPGAEQPNGRLCDWQALGDLVAAGWEVRVARNTAVVAADLSAPTTVNGRRPAQPQSAGQHVGSAVTSFAYPFGSLRQNRESRTVRGAGSDGRDRVRTARPLD